MNIVKVVKSVLLGVAFIVASSGMASCQDEEKPKSLKVLMIGNSFSICVGKEMPQIAESMGLKLELGSLYIGGCSLEKHWANWVASTNKALRPYAFDLYRDGKRVCHKQVNIPEALSCAKWDIITFQQKSGLSWQPDSYHPYAEKLQDAIRARLPEAEFVWQETWSYLPWDPNFKRWKIDRDEMYARLHRAYADAAAKKNQRIIPTGTAIQLWRQKLPVKPTENSIGGDVCGSNSAFKKKDDGSYFYKGDTIHLNGYGHYLQALVWTAKLFGVDVRKCDYAPKWIAPEKVALMKEVAMEAVRGPSEVRELRVKSYESQRIGVGLEKEFPGARGHVDYTNGVARMCFDFSKGGHYVTLSLGTFQPGVQKFVGVFSNDSKSRLYIGLRVSDEKGDVYRVGGTLEGGVTNSMMAFDFGKLHWAHGKSTNATERATAKGALRTELLIEPETRGSVGSLEMRDLRLTTSASADVERDWVADLRPSRQCSVFYRGESVEFCYKVRSLRLDDEATHVRPARVVISDWRDVVVNSRQLSDTAGTVQFAEDELKGVGAFKARFFGLDKRGNEVLLDQVWFAYLTGRSKPTGWCGTGVHGWGNRAKYEQIARAGIGVVRNDYMWPGCEKEKGVYRERLEVQGDVKTMRELGIVPHMILNGTNKIYENPVDHEAFSNWIRWAFMTDLKNVDTVEVWNECWNNYFGRNFGPYEKKEWIRRYVAFSKSAAKTVHEVCPDANVMVCAEDGSKAVLWMMDDGIAGPDDIVSFHPYIHGKDPRPERLNFFFDDEGETLRAHGKPHGVTRFRITEAGWTTFSLNPDGSFEHWFVGAYPCVSFVEQANYIIRAFLISRSCGVEVMMQYDFQNDGPRRNYTEHNFGLVFQDLTPKPSFAAVAFMTRLLGDAKPLGRYGTLDRKDARQYAFELADGRKAYAMWSVEKPIDVEIPSDIRGGNLFDLMGNREKLGDRTKLTLTESPVYLVAVEAER